jgi:hypothetical protein
VAPNAIYITYNTVTFLDSMTKRLRQAEYRPYARPARVQTTQPLRDHEDSARQDPLLFDEAAATPTPWWPAFSPLKRYLPVFWGVDDTEPTLRYISGQMSFSCWYSKQHKWRVTIWGEWHSTSGICSPCNPGECRHVSELVTILNKGTFAHVVAEPNYFETNRTLPWPAKFGAVEMLPVTARRDLTHGSTIERVMDLHSRHDTTAHVIRSDTVVLRKGRTEHGTSQLTQVDPRSLLVMRDQPKEITTFLYRLFRAAVRRFRDEMIDGKPVDNKDEEIVDVLGQSPYKSESQYPEFLDDLVAVVTDLCYSMFAQDMPLSLRGLLLQIRTMANYLVKTAAVYHTNNKEAFRNIVEIHTQISTKGATSDDVDAVKISQMFSIFPIECVDIAATIFLLRAHIPTRTVIHITVGHGHTEGLCRLFERFTQFRHVHTQAAAANPRTQQCINLSVCKGYVQRSGSSVAVIVNHIPYRVAPCGLALVQGDIFIVDIDKDGEQQLHETVVLNRQVTFKMPPRGVVAAFTLDEQNTFTMPPFEHRLKVRPDGLILTDSESIVFVPQVGLLHRDDEGKLQIQIEHQVAATGHAVIDGFLVETSLTPGTDVQTQPARYQINVVLSGPYGRPLTFPMSTKGDFRIPGINRLCNVQPGSDRVALV